MADYVRTRQTVSAGHFTDTRSAPVVGRTDGFQPAALTLVLSLGRRSATKVRAEDVVPNAAPSVAPPIIRPRLAPASP